MGEGVAPRTPVLIGAAQRTFRDRLAPEPLEMMADTSREAARDTEATGSVLDAVDSVRVVHCLSWPYDDPPRRLAERLGLAEGHRHYTGIGGTTPQVQIGEAAEAILRGDHDLVLIAGGEALDTKRQLRKLDQRPDWSHRNPEKVAFPLEAPIHPGELAHGLFSAFLTFALFDNARRAHLGRSRGAYRAQLGELLAPMTAVAAKNPHAWFPIERSAAEIADPSGDNRLVSEPYTKYMVAIMDVDMAGTLLLASESKADELGVPRDRRVYPRGWAYGNEVWNLAERDELWAAPGLGLVAGAALEMAGVHVADVSHLDLYSCFPSSINLAADALGIDPLAMATTVTGGLPYAGGPANNYMTHSIATMADVLRSDPGSVGLVSGVGMHMTKHAYGAWSTDAPTSPLVPIDGTELQARLDALPRREIIASHEGPATLATYTIRFDRGGEPEELLAICELNDGRRTYAASAEAPLLDAALADGLVGAPVHLTPVEGGRTSLTV